MRLSYIAPMDFDELGEELRRIRKKSGLTQDDVAAQLSTVGGRYGLQSVSRATVSNLERGEQRIVAPWVPAFAEACGHTAALAFFERASPSDMAVLGLINASQDERRQVLEILHALDDLDRVERMRVMAFIEGLRSSRDE